MIKAYSIADVRAAEARAMAALPEGELMSRASGGLAEVAAARLAERGGRRVVALVGPGNNGADALYAVGRLAQAGHNAAAVVSAARVDDEAVEAVLALGATVVGGSDAHWHALLEEADVVLDGITGIGGRPGLSAEARRWVDAVPADAWVVAVDLPSGTDPAGERACADTVFADETVTFSVAKPVHLLPATEPAVGRLTMVDIGLDLDGFSPAVERLAHDDVAALWPVPTAGSDKYSRGVVGIVAGSPTYPGAAVLSVLGALGAGPGMIRYLGAAEVVRLVHVAAPEVVTAPGRVQAWVVGSGMDPEDTSEAGTEQRRRVEEALASDLPVVVDAGALDLVERRDAPTLLTPHAGELARLLTRLGAGPGGARPGGAGPDGPGSGASGSGTSGSGTSGSGTSGSGTSGSGTSGSGKGPGRVEVTREDVTRAPLEHARAAALRTGATVLLKGAHTIVVSPDPKDPVRSQADGPPWLATAGAGDVLGGVLGTLCAAGLSPLDAGSLGALVHGVAADRCNPGGPIRARDVAHGIPATVAALLARG
jgi:NAD(P)H-hydrate repair Nnr-like enzyme with NAD(P)H-hydrate dehydratase domain/NAD(P)H-hydrate repair Nnr-like enzyme with NAD(P)H-hydrate epimerase domain